MKTAAPIELSLQQMTRCRDSSIVWAGAGENNEVLADRVSSDNTPIVQSIVANLRLHKSSLQ